MNEPTVIPCPECLAPAHVSVTDAVRCRIVEAINSAGHVLVHEGVEILEMVAVHCESGHRFWGPAELVLRQLPVACREPASA